jgi:HD-like signal output (HDOD) protein
MARSLRQPLSIPFHRMSLLKSLFKSSKENTSAETRHEAAPEVHDGPQVLLCGDDFSWLEGRREIAGRRIVRAATADEANTLIASERFDGVLAGFRGVRDSIAVLDAAKVRHPYLALVVRADAEEMEGIRVRHLVHPRTRLVEVMDDHLRTAFAVAKWRSNPDFANLLASIRNYPALPGLYLQITQALESEDSTLDSIAALVSREPTVSAKLLQMVNSPVIGRQQRVTSIREATHVMGLSRLRSLVLANSLFGQFDGSKCQGFSAAQFEARSVQIGTWASGIALAETFDKRMAELAFSAGLLHQFGVLLMAANLPEAYGEVLRTAQAQRISIARVERNTYGVTHAELAGYILGSWNIPYPIVNAVGWYSRPSQSEDTAFSALTAVHAANSVDAFERTGMHEFDRDYLERMTKVANLEVWHKSLTGDGWTG